jgi:hypothetical protein
MRIDALEKIVARIIEDATAGRHDAAWTLLESLLSAQRGQENIASSLIGIVASGHLPTEMALHALAEIYSAHSQNASVLGLLGQALEEARDIDLLNAPPPEHPLFLNVVNTLTELSEKAEGGEAETQLLQGLATAARMMARQRDEVVERCCRRLIELNPKDSNRHYDFGLFLKTRGRFREGMIANEAAEELADRWPESYEWNLGICATGAGEGAVALQVWKRLDQKIEMGRFELPDGKYPQCKVRLAQRPLAERAADSDDPGLEETIWVERLSPCQQSAGQIADATDDLERDAIVYSHSENTIRLCESCWRNPDLDHRHEGTVEQHVVSGRIAAPADFDVRELLRELDAAVAKREPCRIYTPDLCDAAGLTARAVFERRRFEMITSS